jgi:hypothetical protein
MKKFGCWSLPAMATLVWASHLFASSREDAFGLDSLRYFPASSLLFLGLAFLILLAFLLLFPIEKYLAKFDSIPVWLLLFSLWMALLYLLRTSAPLLGDGLDRLSALDAGLTKMLRNQPAPLDLFVHWAVFRMLSGFGIKSPYWSYAGCSYLAGGLYFLSLLALGKKLFKPGAARIFFLSTLMACGYVQLFAGYAENYSFLPATLLFWMSGSLESEKGKFWMLTLGQLLLILLHFFFILLLPVSIWLLWARPEKIKWAWTAALTIMGAALLVLAFFIVHTSYRGTSIFLAPGAIASLAHLADFGNYQILAAPALPVLCWGAIFITGKSFSRLEKSMAAACFIFLVFFFILRPLLGAVRDWDLFSIPAMIYMPLLALFVFRRTAADAKFTRVLGACAFLVSAFHTGSWLWLNHSEELMVRRISCHLEQRQERERWASSYGFLTMAKYYRQTGISDKADAAYQKAISIHPGYSINRQEYGLFLFSQGRYLEAVKQLAMAQSLNPTNPGIKKLLANVYLAYARSLITLGKNDEAEKSLLKLLALAPDWPPVMSALVDFYRNTVPDPEKAEHYQQMLDRLAK